MDPPRTRARARQPRSGGELGVIGRHPVGVIRGSDEPDGDPIGPQVDVGSPRTAAVQRADGLRQSSSSSQRAGCEEGVGAIGEDAPVVGALSVLELAGSELAHRATAAGACFFATSPMISASSFGFDHIGQWLVGRSIQVVFRSSGMPARNAHSGCSRAYFW